MAARAFVQAGTGVAIPGTSGTVSIFTTGELSWLQWHGDIRKLYPAYATIKVG